MVIAQGKEPLFRIIQILRTVAGGSMQQVPFAVLIVDFIDAIKVGAMILIFTGVYLVTIKRKQKK